MAKIISKYLSIIAGGTPQPLIGTKTSAAIAAAFTPNQLQTVAVTDSSIFDPGDTAWVDLNARAEFITIQAVGNNTITAVFAESHASGVYVTLALKITNFFVQAKEGNSGLLSLFYAPNQFKALATYGRSSLAPAASTMTCGLMTIEKVSAGTQPYYGVAANNYGGNPDNSAFLWIDGQTSDQFLPWLDQT